MDPAPKSAFEELLDTHTPSPELIRRAFLETKHMASPPPSLAPVISRAMQQLGPEGPDTPLMRTTVKLAGKWGTPAAATWLLSVADKNPTQRIRANAAQNYIQLDPEWDSRGPVRAVIINALDR